MEVWTSNTTPAWKGPGRVIPAKGIGAGLRSRPGLVVAVGGGSKPKILWGSSSGHGGVSETNTALKPKIMRMYEGAGSTPGPSGGRTLPQWSDCAGSNAPSGMPIVYSSNPDITMMATRNMTKGSSYYNAVTAWRNILGTAPDDGTMLRHIFRHEPVINSTLKKTGVFTPADYVKATLNWKSDVIDYVNTQLNRTNKWFFDLAGTGFSLDTTAGTADYEKCYNSDVVAVADCLGADCYGPSQMQEAADWAYAQKKPWSIPEYGGPHAGGSIGDYTDTQLSDYMKNNTPGIPKIKSGPTGAKVANPPLYVCWFNGNGTYITGQTAGVDNTPLSKAYWLSVDKGTAV